MISYLNDWNENAQKNNLKSKISGSTVTKRKSITKKKRHPKQQESFNISYLGISTTNFLRVALVIGCSGPNFRS